ncbi:MAG: hypothetical protein KGI10_01100 [Thaumarchaeota archaeon]|nr:hypothetical protein [Nitrososphaerota archaeon]
MKTMHILIITVLVFSTLLYVKPIQADNENGIKIQNIQTLPTAIIIGQTFKINATLINNSTTPIFIERGSCGSPFSVTFDNHVVVRTNNVTCTLQLLVQRLDPGTKITSTSPNLDLTYVAAKNGTVNATVSFPYNVWNQTSQSNTKVNVSKPFSFIIYPKTRVPALSAHDNQAIINVALGIPDLQKWSNDWQFVSMGFMTAKNQPGNWQYAIVNLKASSNSSLIPCDNNNDWWAWVMIDRTTMKVIQATYPTMESHNCNYSTGGGPQSYGGTIQKIESPLKQFKSGIEAKDVKCGNGLSLVIKAEDNSPACIKTQTAQNLIERGWALTRLSIDGLKEIYNMGEKIGFIIDFQGVSRYCDHPDVSVLDSNQNIVWNSQDVYTMCVPPPYSPFLSGVDQSFDLNSKYGGPMIINKTGNYTVKISLDGNNIERGFTIK